MKKLNLRRITNSRIKMLTFISFFAILGSTFIFNSFAATPTLSIEAESFTFPSNQTWAINPEGNTEAKLWWNTSGTKEVTFDSRITKLNAVMRADNCEGWPIAEIKIDNDVVLRQAVESTVFTSIGASVSVLPGKHTVSIAFLNDFGRWSKTIPNKMDCDRNLFVDKLTFSGEEYIDPVTSTQDSLLTSIKPADFTYGSSGMSYGTSGIVWSNGTAQANINLPSESTVIIPTLYGDECEGLPKVTVAVDDKVILSGAISSKNATDYAVKTVVSKGAHVVKISLTNDYKTASCDRNIRFTKVDVRGLKPIVTAPAAPLPLGIYGNKNLGAYRLVYSSEFATWRQSQTSTTMALLKKIADQPGAFWLGYSDDQSKLSKALSESTAANKVPVFVLYNIPNRDNGQYAAGSGGAKDTAAYKAWIDMIYNSIGEKKAILILEPDALGQGITGQYRTESLQYATQKLGTLKNAKTYIDATNSSWYGYSESRVAQMADRLKTIGLDRIAGISLNVANFQTNEKEIAFGNKLINLNGGTKKMVLDTSRNGNGPRPAPVTDAEKLEFSKQINDGEYYWCNPPGRALGAKPTLQTGQPNVDAYLWIKVPGEIDGPCRGAVKDVGNFWIAYGLELARNTKWQ